MFDNISYILLRTFICEHQRVRLLFLVGGNNAGEETHFEGWHNDLNSILKMAMWQT